MDLLPHPAEIVEAFVAFMSGASVYDHLFPSVWRVVIALVISALIGGPVGLIAAMRNPAGRLTSGLVSAIRYLPPTAFIGLLVLGFGIGPTAAIALIIIGVAPYVAVMSADAFRSVPAEYAEVARAFGASKLEILQRVVMPFVAPRLVDAIKVNVGAAWTFLVVAEIIAGSSGVGFLIARAQRYLNIQELYSLLLVCGISGLLMDRSLELLSRFMGRWSRHAFDRN
jgi:NitT/TauT family transport system permease protein